MDGDCCCSDSSGWILLTGTEDREGRAGWKEGSEGLAGGDGFAKEKIRCPEMGSDHLKEKDGGRVRFLHLGRQKCEKR